MCRRWRTEASHCRCQFPQGNWVSLIRLTTLRVYPPETDRIPELKTDGWQFTVTENVAFASEIAIHDPSAQSAVETSSRTPIRVLADEIISSMEQGWSSAPVEQYPCSTAFPSNWIPAWLSLLALLCSAISSPTQNFCGIARHLGPPFV